MLRLKEARMAAGISQAKLAELSGTPKRTIEDAEAHSTDCKLSNAAKWAKALNITIDSLWLDD